MRSDLSALVWGAYHFRIRQLQHQFEMTLYARVGERTRIGRELYHTLLQSAHGLLLRFQIVSQLLPNRPVEAKEKLDEAIEQTAEFVTEARDEVQGLRDSTVESNDLAMAINTLGEELAIHSANRRPAFRVAVEGESRDLYPIVRDEIYKIAAEALRNAFRHSEAQQVEVEIRYGSEEFRLRVRDDGKGIDPAILEAKAVRDTMACLGCGNARHLPEVSSVSGVKWMQAPKWSCVFEPALRTPLGEILLGGHVGSRPRDEVGAGDPSYTVQVIFNGASGPKEQLCSTITLASSCLRKGSRAGKRTSHELLA